MDTQCLLVCKSAASSIWMSSGLPDSCNVDTFQKSFSPYPSSPTMGYTLVTGCASGIGAATAATLKAAGHKILGCDRAQADICADLSLQEGRDQLKQAVREYGERLNGLVLCAGLGPNHPDAGQIIAVNYFATVQLLDGLLPLLMQGTNASAVVISSIASTQLSWEKNPLSDPCLNGDEADALTRFTDNSPKGRTSAYCASKNALTVAVRQRAPSWGKSGVRLNSIAPGAVETPMMAATLQDPNMARNIQRHAPPISRAAQPDEVASLTEFLLSDRSRFVHGAQLVIDGGKDAVLRPYRF
jgi:3alpha-hydroxysteroid 3-dehydrogenase